MNKIVYKKLIEVAKNKTFITYSDLVSQCSLKLNLKNIKDRNELSKILGEISEYEIKKGRFMLSAIVILKSEDIPKPAYGFFSWADELGVRKEDETDLKLFYRQVNGCWDFWSKERKG